MDEMNGPSLRQSPAIGQLAAALAKAQKRMTTAAKDNVNPHFKSKYADLASVWDACRVALTDNELSVLQPVSSEGTRVTVTTILVHSSGEFISEALTMTALQNTPQAVGSTITYGRRYGLAAMVGVAPDDDDGNAASTPPPPQRRVEREQETRMLETELPPERTITEKQRLTLVAAAGQAGWKAAEVGAMLQQRLGVTRSHQIPASQYDKVLQILTDGVDRAEAETRG